MTVVAAFAVHGVPVLFGDLLLTSNAGPESQSHLPTNPTVSASMPSDIGARVVGARKKVHLIGNKLAVAWSGSFMAASSVLAELNAKFSSMNSDVSELEAELSQITMYSDGIFAVNLIGWVIDPHPRCFRWNSMWPAELFFEDAHFDGSGARMFLDTLSPVGQLSGMGPGVESAEEAATLTLLAKASKLMDNEIWSGETIRNRFGYCYEIAFYDGSKFRYVEQIAYLTWEVGVDPVRKGYAYRVGPVLLKYRNMGEYSVVQTTRFADGKPAETHVDLITPAYSHMPQLDPTSLGRIPIESDFYCNFLRYRLNSQTSFTGPFVTAASDQTRMGHKLKDGKDFFWLNMASVNETLGIRQPF